MARLGRDPQPYGSFRHPVRQDPTQYIIRVHWGGNIVIASIPDFCYLKPLLPSSLPSFPSNWPSANVALGATIPQYDITLNTTATLHGNTTLDNLASTAGLQDGYTYGVTGTGIPPDTTLFFLAGSNGGTLSNAATIGRPNVDVNIFHWLFQPLQSTGASYQIDIYETTVTAGSSYTTIENPVPIFLAYLNSPTLGTTSARQADLDGFVASPSPDHDISRYYWTFFAAGGGSGPQFFNGIRLQGDETSGFSPPTVADGEGRIMAYLVTFGIADWTVDYVVNMERAQEVAVMQESTDFAPGYRVIGAVTLRAYPGGSTFKIDNTFGNRGHIIAVDPDNTSLVIDPIWIATAPIQPSWLSVDTQIASFNENGSL